MANIKKVKKSQINEDALRQMIRDAIQELMDEKPTDIEETTSVNGMAGGDSYMTPAAFVGKGGRNRKNNWHKNTTDKLGWEPVWDEEDADELEEKEDIRTNWVGKKSAKQLSESMKAIDVIEYKVNSKLILYYSRPEAGQEKTFMYTDKKLQNIYKQNGSSVIFLIKDIYGISKYPSGKQYKSEKVIGKATVNESKIKEGTDEIVKIYIGNDPYWLRKMGDTTHFHMANSEKGIKAGGETYHIGQHKDELYYNDIVKWLKGGKINGKKYKKFLRQESIKEEVNQQAKDDVISLLKKYNGKEIPDDKVHAIADAHKISPHDLESFIYSLSSAHVNEVNIGKKGIVKKIEIYMKQINLKRRRNKTMDLADMNTLIFMLYDILDYINLTNENVNEVNIGKKGSLRSIDTWIKILKRGIKDQYAFDKDDMRDLADSLKDIKQSMESLNENRRGAYQIYRDDGSKNTQQKIGESLKRMRTSLKELNKEINLNLRLKTESGIEGQTYWKRTKTDLNKITEHIHKLLEKIRRF